MWLAIIITSAVLLVLIIVFSIVSSVKRTEKMKYYTAAGNTLREEYLNYSLRNNISNEDVSEPKGIKLMICIKTKCGKKKIQYVFNPENRIFIGRDKYDTNIYVNDNTVSKKHCCIYLKDNQVYLEDLNSANGTIVKRGLFKKYAVNSNYKIILKSRDRFVVGSNAFSVVMFYYDMSTI